LQQDGKEVIHLVKPGTVIQFNWHGRNYVLFTNEIDVVVRLMPWDVTSIGVTMR
jgi:hypothetical protein